MRSMHTRASLGLAVVALASFLAPLLAQPPAVRPARGIHIRGRIVRVVGEDRFIVRTADNREVILHATPESRFIMKGRVVRFADLRPGVMVTTDYDVVRNRNVVSTVTLGPGEVTEAATPEEPILEGTVVRVLEPQNQFVVRTAAGKEVIVYGHPRTAYTFNGRAVRLGEIRTGANVRIHYDMRNERPMARSVIVTTRRVP